MIDYLGADPAVEKLIGQVGALLVGHRTFRCDSLTSTPTLTHLWLRVLR